MLKWLRPDTVYVPIVGDMKPYADKWSDKEYLRGMIHIAGNEFWKTELLQGLSDLRNAADKAKTPDELTGCNAGISVLKHILTAPVRAKLRLELLNNEQG